MPFPGNWTYQWLDSYKVAKKEWIVSKVLTIQRNFKAICDSQFILNLQVGDLQAVIQYLSKRGQI